MRKPALLLILLLLLSACAGAPKQTAPAAPQKLQQMGYTIQAGAFSDVDNAARLTARLESSGLRPYYFRHTSGLYKVRFGNFGSFAAARSRAQALKAAGVIDVYYIVAPEQVASKKKRSERQLRKDLVKTAERYLGIPYKWGGTNSRTGFDCSGLTMAVYHYNGLNMPRVSRDQYRAGQKIYKHQLKRGDLVFFATSGGKRVSHVGIYVGNSKFIHAPGRGKRIKYNSLDDKYYKKHYVGARRYI